MENEKEKRMYHNPVHRGFFPDPSVVRVGEDYYMVNSTFQYFPAIVISHSTDLVHWEIIGHAITDPEELDLSDIKDSHGIWAPDIAYENGRFIIMATLRLNGDGKRALTASPCGWKWTISIPPCLWMMTGSTTWLLLRGSRLFP